MTAFRVAARISSLWGRWIDARCWGSDYTREDIWIFIGKLTSCLMFKVLFSLGYQYLELSHLFFAHLVYMPPSDRQTDRQTHTHTHTHTHKSKFLRAGLLSCPLLSLYFEGCFCCCLLKGKKCLTYKISSKPKEKVSDPGKSGLFFGSFIQSHSFCKDMLKLSARQSVRQG